MREIKFRGRDGHGKWYYGTALRDTSGFAGIITSYQKFPEKVVYNRVFPATVGQFTGLLDKTGKEIYEGDVLQTEKFGKDDGQGHNFSGKENFQVVFEHGAYRIKRGGRKLLLVDGSHYNIIGNVHDAPELLKK